MLAGTGPCAARMSVHVAPPFSEYSSTWPSKVLSVSKRWKKDRMNPGGMFPAEAEASRWSVITSGSATNQEWVGEFDCVVTMAHTLLPVPSVVQYGLPLSTLSVAVALGPPGTALRSVVLVSSIPLLQGPVPEAWLSSARTM